MALPRRRTRSARIVAAVAVLATATFVAAVALLTGTVPALAGATVLGVVAGAVAVALMSAEIVVMRRLWAFDRASLADTFRQHTRERHAAHMTFVDDVARRLVDASQVIALRDAEIAALQDAVLTAEIDTAIAQERFSAEKARSRALLADADAAASDLASAREDLRQAQDALAASEAAGVAARAEIVAWEEAAAVPAHGRRRLA